MFVDRLTTVKPMSSAERRAVQAFLEGAVDLDDIVLRTVRLLAQLTRQVAVVQYPSLTKSRVRHVELVGVSARRLMVVVITTTGRVEQRLIDTPGDVDDESVAQLRAAINSAATGRLLTEVPDALDQLVPAFDAALRPAVTAVVSTLLESLVEGSEERLVLAGTSNLALFGADFSTSIQPVLEALEEQVVLLHLLGEVAVPSAVSVRIGHELPVERLSTTSLVTASYGEEAAGRLGVLGPTRMDYPGTMTAVAAVARYVGRYLEDSS
jgi:heat-inducible transcriptional repressor